MAPPLRSGGLSPARANITTGRKCAHQTNDKEQFLFRLKKVFQRFTGLYPTFLQRWTDHPGYCVHRINLQGNGGRIEFLFL